MDTIVCPNCHHVWSYNFRSSPHQSSAKLRLEDEVAHIHNETRRLERLISQLHAGKAELSRRLGVIQSPTSSLPIETLSLIFELLCPALDFSDRHTLSPPQDANTVQLRTSPLPQLTLSAVSSHWRQVMFSDARLWSSFALDTHHYTLRKDATLLRLFLENSKKMPFFLSLRFSATMAPSHQYLFHKEVDGLIVANLPRVQQLHLVHPPHIWHTFTHLLTNLTESSLYLKRPASHTPDKMLVLPLDAPLLRFSLHSALWMSDNHVQLPTSTITSLTLVAIPPDHSVQIFLRCPNLVEFRCSEPSTHTLRIKPVTLITPITYKYLEVFEWETPESTWSRALIQFLHFPVLREMQLAFIEDTTDADIHAFMARLPPTLTRLELFPPQLFDHIRDDLNIEYLIFSDCTSGELTSLCRRLRPRVEGNRVVKPLPRLNRLICGEKGTSVVEQLDPSVAIIVLGILDKRLDSSNKSFRLHLHMAWLNWPPEAHRRLAELGHAGFSVHVHDTMSSYYSS